MPLILTQVVDRIHREEKVLGQQHGEKGEQHRKVREDEGWDGRTSQGNAVLYTVAKGGGGGGVRAKLWVWEKDWE